MENIYACIGMCQDQLEVKSIKAGFVAQNE